MDAEEEAIMNESGADDSGGRLKRALSRETIEERSSLRIDEPGDVLEADYERKNLGIMLLQFFIPFAIAGIFFFLLYLALEWDVFNRLGALSILYFVPPAGKETVIPTGVLVFGIHPLLMAMPIAFLDIVVGLFLVWNFDLAKKVPLLGKWICKFEASGSDVLEKKPWIEKLAFVGLVGFVIFPFQGSGGVGTSILGRVIGMEPYKVLAAIAVGAVSGTVMIAYIAFFFGNALFAVFKTDAFKLLGVVIVAVVLLALYGAYRKRKERFA